MQSVAQGRSIDLDLVIKDHGEFVEPLSVAVSVARPDGTFAVSDSPGTRLRLGLWRFSFAVPSSAAIGIWSVTWVAQTVSGQISSTDPFEVREAGTPFRTESTHIDRWTRGERVPLDVVFRRGGLPIAASSVSVSLADPSGSSVTVSIPPEMLAVGVYRAWWDAPYNARTGVYVATWTATVAGSSVAAEEPFEVLAEDTEAPQFSAGVERVAVGSIRAFDAVYRTASGLLWDPETVEVSVTDPNGSKVLDRSPDRLATGVYRETLPLGVTGFWLLDWSGAEDAISVDYMAIAEAVESGAGGPDVEDQHLFGATVQGVRALLPHFLLDRTSTMTIRQADQHIDNIAAQVSFRIGDYSTAITDQGLVGRVTAMAKYVVELGAAASIQDGGFPANAGPNQSEYGAKLWERYGLALAELVQVVNDATPGSDPGAGAASGGTIGVIGSGPLFRVGMMT